MDGWEIVTERRGYFIYRKILKDENGKIIRGIWKARKNLGNHRLGEMFDITYEQAIGYEPIDETEAMSKALGKTLLPRR